MKTSFILVLILMNSCNLMKYYQDDNFVEEIVEEIIQEKTGLDLDISPRSEENRKKQGDINANHPTSCFDNRPRQII